MNYLMRIALAHLPDVLTLTFCGSCTVWQLNKKRKLTGKDVVEGYTWCIGVK